MNDNLEINFIEDLPAAAEYFKLFESTDWNIGYGADLHELFIAISNSWYTLSGYSEKNELIGFGRIVSDGILYAFICDMIIDPAYQNRGLGGILLKKLLARCKKAKIRVVWLMAASDKSHFYKKFGFEERPANAPGMQLNLNIKA